MTDSHLPAFLNDNYEVHEWRHALAILRSDFPVEFEDICDVLTHMHTQSPPIIHRDLKPDNIMLLEDQKSIKMIDFGTANIANTPKTKSPVEIGAWLANS